MCRPKRGRGRGRKDPNGVCIELCAQCLLPVGTTTGHFLLRGLGGYPPHRGGEGGGGLAGHPEQCPLAKAKVCHGEAVPCLSLHAHLQGTILVVTRGMHGAMARVPPELEGIAQVVELRQVQEYAAVTDFMWLRRMNLVLDNPKKEAGKGMCPSHQPGLISYRVELLQGYKGGGITH